MLGLVAKLFHDKLTLGAYALIPYSKFTGADAFYSDEREQYFTNSLHPELYGDRLVATSIAFAGGLKLSDALSLGLGLHPEPHDARRSRRRTWRTPGSSRTSWSTPT